MWLEQKKYRNSVRPLILLAFLSFDIALHAQQKDTARLVYPPNPGRISGYINYFFNDSVLKADYPLIPVIVPATGGSSIFLDSLKIKASKKLITRTLYDFLVVSGPTAPSNQLSGSSDLNYLGFSGKRIRNIDIQRMSVFGSNLTNQAVMNPNKLETILNKTHMNTNEHIIRKNLLFSEGDTVSPLKLSDNERILRELPYIDDSRIVVIPVSDEEVDILVLTKDVYSLGASFDYRSISRGTVAVFEKNIFGMGHEFRVEVPYDSDLPDSPGFGIKYNINNISRSFTNLRLFYLDGLGKKTYGVSLEKKLLSAETRYAGGISVSQMFTTEDLDTLSIPEPLKLNFQDYWLSRSFLIDRESVTRIIISARYTNNNVFAHPVIDPNSYHDLQKYRMFLGSASISFQKYYKTSLIYNYGRTEDIPHGGLFNITMGKELSEFKDRLYTGMSISAGESVKTIGYLYANAAIGTFFYDDHTEQGIFILRANYFSNLYYIGSSRLRNFVKVDYTRGFDRYSDESLSFVREDGFSGFRNDSAGSAQRLSLGFESVLFSPVNFYGFRFAFFGFADLGYLFGTNEFAHEGNVLSSIGLGIRIRNDNLVFNTFQIRLGYFPNLPQYSKVNYFMISGEQLFKPDNFDPDPPSQLPYH